MITAGSEYNGNEAINVIVRPAFIGVLPPRMTPIYTEGAGSVKKTLFGSNGHALMKYASGFQGGTASAKKQKKFTLGEWKAENSWSKQDYSDLIQRQAEDIKMAFQNDIFQSEFAERIPWGLLGLDPNVEPTEETLVSAAEYMVQSMGIAEGIFNTFFLADTDKIIEYGEEGDGTDITFPDGTTGTLYAEDERFSAVKGLWANIMDIAAASPTVNQIKKVSIAHSTAAVAQVDTLTFTGTSGTATVTAKGVAKTATFDTDLATTAENFADAHASDYADVGLTLAYPGSGNAVTFTAVTAGVEFGAVTVANATGDLAGSRAATTANVEASGLADDKARDTFRSMVTGQNKALKQIPNSRKILLATLDLIENYQETLGADGADAATSESARNVMVNGVETLRFNGIEIYPMPIDYAIAAYKFGYPSRAILTVPENIGMVLSSANGFAESALWWNKDENENRTRTQLEHGGDIFLPELTVVAY